ncbi:MAG: hypothetical protein AAFP84_04415 [Actinomycetota bacterium]
MIGDGRATPAGVIGADVVALVVSLVVSISVWLDTSVAIRPVAALVFVVFVPGWTILRAVDVTVSSLMVLASCVLSVVAMVFTSFLLATRLGWAWEAAIQGWAVGCAAGVATVLLQTNARSS